MDKQTNNKKIQMYFSEKLFVYNKVLPDIYSYSFFIFQHIVIHYVRFYFCNYCLLSKNVLYKIIIFNNTLFTGCKCLKELEQIIGGGEKQITYKMNM